MKLSFTKNEKLLVAAIIVVIALALASFINSEGLLKKNHMLQDSYLSLGSDYTSLLGRYGALSSSYNALYANYSALGSSYSKMLYNATHLFTQAIFKEKLINLNGVSMTYLGYNYSTETYWYKQSCGLFNYSFYLPYNGYLAINVTSTVRNSPPVNSSGNADPNKNFALYLSSSPPINRSVATSGSNTISYKYPCGLSFNPKVAPQTTVIPYGTATYLVPVQKGANYLLIENYNASPETLAVNMKYLGYLAR